MKMTPKTLLTPAEVWRAAGLGEMQLDPEVSRRGWPLSKAAYLMKPERCGKH